MVSAAKLFVLKHKPEYKSLCLLKLRAHDKPETSLVETARQDDFHVRSVSEDDMFVACHCRDKTFMV